MDNVLKEELGSIYIGVPGFYEAYFGKIADLELIAKTVFQKCKEGDTPLYQEKGLRGWRNWPKITNEQDILHWFAQSLDQLLDLAKEHRPTGTRRRLLAQPCKPLQGSTAKRKLDIGFINDPNAGKDPEYHWLQVLVPGELKSNPAANTASSTWLNLGRYARKVLIA